MPMVPLAAIVCLAVIGASAVATDGFTSKLHGPYRHPGPHERDVPPFPLSYTVTRSTIRKSHQPSAAPLNSTSEDTTTDLSHGPTSSSNSDRISFSNSPLLGSALASLTTPDGSFATNSSKNHAAHLASGTAPLRLPASMSLRSTNSTAHPPSKTRPIFSPPRPTNATCGGATLNIRNASLDYWYAQTYTQVDSIFMIKFDDNATSTGWTLLSAESTFNVTSAIDLPTCTSQTAFNTMSNQTMLQYSCMNTPSPLAAATTVVEQTAYKSIKQTAAKGSIPDVVITPTPAVVTVDDSSKTVSVGTPVVHFSQYEIVSKQPYRDGHGSMGCVESTEVHDLPTKASVEFAQDSDFNGTLAVGRIQFAFLQALNDVDVTVPKSVSLGSFVAEPTLLVVVQQIVVAAGALAGITEESATRLAVPTATLPSGLSFERTTPTGIGIVWAPLTAHIESSQLSLQVPAKTINQARPTKQPDTVPHLNPPGSNGAAATSNENRVVLPFIAHLESGDITLAIKVNPTAAQSVVTANFNGRIVTATRADGLGTNKPDSADVGHVFSTVLGAAQPTRAAEVLSESQLRFSPDPVANAILAGIRGGSKSGAGSGHADFGDAVSWPGASGSISDLEFGAGTDTDHRAVLTIGDEIMSATRMNEALVLGTQTAFAGGPPIVVNGKTVSLARGATAVVVDGLTVGVAPTAMPGAAVNIPIIAVGSETFTANAATQFHVDGNILTPGGTAVISGMTVSLAPAATRLVVDGQTRQLSAPALTPAPHLTVDGTVYLANIGSTYNIGSQLLTPGGKIVLHDSTISLAAGASQIVINSFAQPVGVGSQSGDLTATITAPPMLTVNGKAFSPNAGTSYIISGQTLTPGGAITLDGVSGPETVSLDGAATKLVTFVDGRKVISYIGMVGAAPGGAPMLTINGQTLTAADYDAGTGATYVVDGQTLAPGGTITLSGADGGETISLSPAGTAIIVGAGGSTTTSSISGAYGVRPTIPPILTIGDQSFSAINNGATYIIEGQTLVPGGFRTVTLGGHTYILKLRPQATLLEIVELGVASTTIYETLFPATVIGVTSTGTAVRSGFSATQGPSPPYTAASPTGEIQTGGSSIMTFSVIVVAVMFGSLALAV